MYSLPGLKILRGITESRVVVGPGVRPTQLIFVDNETEEPVRDAFTHAWNVLKQLIIIQTAM